MSVLAQPGDGLSIAFIGDVPLSVASGYERSIVSCVADAVREKLSDLRTVPSDVLLKVLFPLSSAHADALDPLSLMLLRDDPTARQRLSAVGIRYVIALSGGSAVVEALPLVLPPILMVAGWKRRSAYSAEIYDVASGQVTGTASAQADATGGWGFGLIPPFLYIVPPLTHARACARLGTAVVEALGGPSAPKD
jgi:hypothetical protein